MPDEIDTLTNSATAAHDMDQGLRNILSQSSSCSQTVAQGVASNLTQTNVATQTTLVAYPDSVSHSQASSQALSGGRQLIPTADIDIDGVAQPGYSISDMESQHYIENLDERTAIEMNSIAAVPQTITFQTSYRRDDLDLEDRVVTLNPGDTKFIGPFPSFIYNQGLIDVYVDVSISGTLRMRAIKVV